MHGESKTGSWVSAPNPSSSSQCILSVLCALCGEESPVHRFPQIRTDPRQLLTADYADGRGWPSRISPRRHGAHGEDSEKARTAFWVSAPNPSSSSQCILSDLRVSVVKTPLFSPPDRRLPTADWPSLHCPLSTVLCLLSTAHCLLPPSLPFTVHCPLRLDKRSPKRIITWAHEGRRVASRHARNLSLEPTLQGIPCVGAERSPRHLYLFLDEGGDFNFTATGTRYFTLTAVAQSRPFEWDEPLTVLKYDLIERGIGLEYFHASEDRQAVRDLVFRIVAASLDTLHIEGLVVEKRNTHPDLHTAERFYPRMLGQLLRAVLDPGNRPEYSELIVITDSLPVSRKRHAIQKAIKHTLATSLPAGTRYTLLHHASKSCMGLQVADYCNWALFRKWERGDPRSYDLIRPGLRREIVVAQEGGADAPE